MQRRNAISNPYHNTLTNNIRVWCEHNLIVEQVSPAKQPSMLEKFHEKIKIKTNKIGI
jgi:hypothetical protein